MEKLLAAQALGGQKPSGMLHDLVQFCPDGEAQTRIFRFLFLQRLPMEIRIILAEDRDSTLAALAARADQLWAHSTRQQHDAAVNAEGHETIAAVSSSHHSRGGGRGRDAVARAAHSAVKAAVAPLSRRLRRQRTATRT
jgi:hypothetical protein